MIAHKFPGIQLDLSSVEVIWLHFTRFFMDLEANFDSSMHVFKEPTGVYYKLTGNYNPKILEEAKQKTINYVQKNKIEMLNTELDHKHYMNICQELRVRFPKIYIQLLHYNVFDYVSRRLHQKFGYKQALQDYQELIKKKKRFCYLICDKAYFPQIKEIFYQLAEPIEKQQASLRRTTSTTTAPTSLPPQQITQQSSTHNRSSSIAVVNTTNSVNNTMPNQEEINIHNFDSSSSPRLALGMKSNSYYDEDDYSYSNQESIDQADFKGLDIQKEDFPCLSDAQMAVNQQLAQLNDSNASNNNGSSNSKSETSKKKNSKKQKKKQQQTQVISKQQSTQHQNQQSVNTYDSSSKEIQQITKSVSQPAATINLPFTKNEQLDEWDFELPTYKQTMNDPNMVNKPLSMILQEEYPGCFNFQKTQGSNSKSTNPPTQLQQQSSDQKQKPSTQQQQQQQQPVDQKSSNSNKKDSQPLSSNSAAQPVNTKSQGNALSQNLQTQFNQQNVGQAQTFPQRKASAISAQSSNQDVFNTQTEQTISSSIKSDKSEVSKEQSQDQPSKTNESKHQDIVPEALPSKQHSSGSKNVEQLHHKHSFSSDYPTQHNQHQQVIEQSNQHPGQIILPNNTEQHQKKMENQTVAEQYPHKEIIINQVPLLLNPSHQILPPGLPPPPNADELSSMKLLSDQNSNASSQIIIQEENSNSNTKIPDTQIIKQKTTELSEKQQKLMKSMKSEPFNPNKGSICLKLDSIIMEQDFKTEELQEKQRIYADEYTETIKVMLKENQYCLKIFKNLSAYNLRKVNIYIENLRVLASPRIVRSFGKTVTYQKSTFDLYLLLDYKERNLLQSVKQKLIISFNDKLLIFWQIAQAIQHIHGHVAEENLIHGNLKPENILISAKKKVFLQDFYILKNRENKYKPKNEGLTQAADIWSFGLIAYFLFTEHLVDSEKACYLISEQVLLNQIYKPNNSEIRVIYTLIERMLDLNPSNRPDIEEIISHLKPIIQKKNKELSVGLNVQSSAFENIPHISQQNINTISLH